MSLVVVLWCAWISISSWKLAMSPSLYWDSPACTPWSCGSWWWRARSWWGWSESPPSPRPPGRELMRAIFGGWRLGAKIWLEIGGLGGFRLEVGDWSYLVSLAPRDVALQGCVSTHWNFEKVQQSFKKLRAQHKFCSITKVVWSCAKYWTCKMFLNLFLSSTKLRRKALHYCTVCH